jgi:hypothetical protein
MNSRRPLASLVTLLAVAASPGCASPPPPAPTAVPKLSPHDELVQVAAHWVSREQERRSFEGAGGVTASSTITTSDLDITSEKNVRESLTIEERLTLGSGTEVTCKSQVTVGLGARYSRREGQPTAELTRPVTPLVRSCSSPPPTGFVAEVPAARWVVVLRGEKLVAVEPATNRRQYLPSD